MRDEVGALEKAVSRKDTVTTHRRLTKTLHPTRPLAPTINERINALPRRVLREQAIGIPTASQQPLALLLYPLLRVAPVPWPQDLHAVTAVHPLWVHVRSGFGRFSGWVGR